MDKIETFFTELMSWVAAEQRNHGAPLTVGHIVSVCATMVIEEYIPPIIEAKDKEIAALEKIRDFHIKENNGKDKRIAELEADLKKVMGLLKKNFMGRQRLFLQSENIGIKYPVSDEDLKDFWDKYCKQNNLPQ